MPLSIVSKTFKFPNKNSLIVEAIFVSAKEKKWATLIERFLKP
ncbi:hypothetical protein D020_0802 [Vibrio parahaemolyticus SBR10290]|nr:hypothetical protein D021_0343 [Vibrio parahaemolyticus 10296]ESW46286.1 hypothetical protein D022_0333 [Vibrio parahaemolyticus 12310]ETJ89424.1 hypothetical protein D029_2058 [Vibrio parahaemolyticus 970107]ETT22461.1 hypothetical protein D023_0775 [Vibrio parahaemolyticus 3256]ETX59251.1 hypothetical protein D020_0802 [Vibrio parahaemolyticus SBR10290]